MTWPLSSRHVAFLTIYPVKLHTHSHSPRPGHTDPTTTLSLSLSLAKTLFLFLFFPSSHGLSANQTLNYTLLTLLLLVGLRLLPRFPTLLHFISFFCVC
ncbi:hypothetical protein L6452_44694 [Arctium lappa]|uniref:Uncharacterized protein n=1 Tax=Arctium lappa TaxID=4217 RepID=A0ACB8XHK0_ARCLA|nr:hypothetical protein L6452_44694 [Arctium lappa]